MTLFIQIVSHVGSVNELCSLWYFSLFCSRMRPFPRANIFLNDWYDHLAHEHMDHYRAGDCCGLRGGVDDAGELMPQAAALLSVRAWNRSQA